MNVYIESLPQNLLPLLEEAQTCPTSTQIKELNEEAPHESEQVDDWQDEDVLELPPVAEELVVALILSPAQLRRCNRLVISTSQISSVSPCLLASLQLLANDTSL